MTDLTVRYTQFLVCVIIAMMFIIVMMIMILMMLISLISIIKQIFIFFNNGLVINMIVESIKSSLVKGKKSLWNFSFPSKVCGRPAHLGGLGEKAITLKLSPSAKYPHLDIKAFLNWSSYDDWTTEEKALVQALLDELDAPSPLDIDECTGQCGGCSNMHECHDLG